MVFTARVRIGLFVAVAAATGLASPAGAQRGVQARRFMVTNFRSAEKNLGQQAADAVRSALEGEFAPRVVQVITKSDINNTLEQSGYSTTEALSSSDAKALANLIRADEYLEGTVAKTATGFRADVRFVLARDNNVGEALASVEGARLGELADKVTREVREARRQVDDEGECYLAARQGKYADAAQRARAAIKRYPKANMMRLCLLTTLQGMKQPTDSLLPVIEDILRADSTSRVALTAASSAYKERNDSTKYIKALVTLAAGDPTNVTLLNRVVSDLGAYRRADVAAPIIKRAVEENPGDANLVSSAWKISLAANDLKDAIRFGDELARLDTAQADVTFFTRMAGAYVSDSQPAKAAEELAKGTAKFPQDVSLWIALGAQQRKNGQIQQSIESLRKVLALEPQNANARLLIAQAFIDAQQADSAEAEIRSALASGGDKARLGPMSLSIANTAYKAANTSKTRDDWQRGLRLAQWADSVAPAPAAKFLTGAAAFNIAIQALQEAQGAKSCELATLARDNFQTTEFALPQGGSINPQAAGQIMGAVQQYGPVAQKMMDAYCKAAPGGKAPPKKPGRG